jgi:hypothetical protein
MTLSGPLSTHFHGQASHFPIDSHITMHFTLKMEVVISSKILVSYCNTTRHYNPYDLELEKRLFTHYKKSVVTVTPHFNNSIVQEYTFITLVLYHHHYY